MPALDSSMAPISRNARRKATEAPTAWARPLDQFVPAAVVVPSDVKASLGIEQAITRVPLLPPWVAAKTVTPGHAERVRELLQKSETFAVKLPVEFADLETCFQNGDAVHRWALMRSRRICLSTVEQPPYLFVQGVQEEPLPGRISKRQVGTVPRSDMDGLIRLTATRDVDNTLRSFCTNNCALWEKIASHEKDTVVTYVVQLQDGKDAAAIRGVACVAPEEAVVRQTELKGLTIKFGQYSTQRGVEMLEPYSRNWHCWLRQHSMRVFAPASDIERIRKECEGVGLRVRTDDRPRTQLQPWTPEIATAPVEDPVVVDDHFVLCSATSMTVKTIQEVCKVLKATPTLGGGVCLRAIRIVFDDATLTTTGGVVPATPEEVKRRGVTVMLESHRAQRF